MISYKSKIWRNGAVYYPQSSWAGAKFRPEDKPISVEENRQTRTEWRDELTYASLCNERITLELDLQKHNRDDKAWMPANCGYMGGWQEAQANARHQTVSRWVAELICCELEIKALEAKIL